MSVVCADCGDVRGGKAHTSAVHHVANVTMTRRSQGGWIPVCAWLLDAAQETLGGRGALEVDGMYITDDPFTGKPCEMSLDFMRAEELVDVWSSADVKARVMLHICGLWWSIEAQRLAAKHLWPWWVAVRAAPRIHRLRNAMVPESVLRQHLGHNKSAATLPWRPDVEIPLMRNAPVGRRRGEPLPRTLKSDVGPWQKTIEGVK